jgi:RNA 2',3'-cyclic 3'-phosphodiesterase
MRLFVAFDLTDSIREAVAQFLGRLRRACPQARWMRPENMHITVKFIGWVPDEQLAEFRAALEQVHSPQPARLEFRGTGFFPTEKRPRVLWIGVQHSPNVAEIAAELDRRFLSLGVEAEKRDFHPHLTLARFATPAGLDPLRAAIRDAGEVNFGFLCANLLHLYQSQLRPGGAEYTRLASFDFLRRVQP